ncbi:ribonuclease HIII [Sporosarcina pasteurii]|uniref:Ribonuclease HIII n=1 Tax=Sporosarcina pasteurii TaxID=1474 RepID=A0A380C3A3_SPOPA|nr:ribonuclease HIII [Sporosarcina pasteurii]MDS9471680.1 ribonuclease HIII [Sporosarcina pasteurii]QBQ04719.1 ribonuclease HIII [Sporosarcina pasteurii]SUJ11980.1 Ribonuclease HIII [Sporosarcina pasteurii]
MSNQVLKLNDEKITELITAYTNVKVVRNAPGVRFAAKTSDTSITVYNSGKVLFQGGGANREASRWGNVEIKKSAGKTNTKGDTLPPNLSMLSVVGSDETGTGDFFGPVTVAACYVPADKIELVRELGVKDSKQLTDDLMRQIAPDLEATLTHSVLTVSNPKYNDIQQQGNSQGKIKALLHNQALKHVLRKMAVEKPDYILVDQFAQRGVYYNYLRDEPEIIRENLILSTKAEGLHVSVAAASILARVAFLKEMDRLSELSGFQLPKGAGPKVDQVAAKILLKHGEATLKTMTKWHFANREKAMKLVSSKKR